MKRRWALAALCLVAGMAAAPALAQEELNKIVVTGSLIASDSEDEAVPTETDGQRVAPLPYVSITVPADFVVFTATVETASRSVDERVRELDATFRSAADRVKRGQGVLLEVGYPGQSAPVETTQAREAIQVRGDRSVIPLVFKFSLQRNDTFPTIRARAEQFLKAIPLTGRVELVIGDSQYIGVTDPKKHREALLQKIAEDTTLLQTTFGKGPTGTPSISLVGLEGRVHRRTVGPLELEMYIPYSVVLNTAKTN